jgi:hypothetical protein
MVVAFDRCERVRDLAPVSSCRNPCGRAFGSDHVANATGSLQQCVPVLQFLQEQFANLPLSDSENAALRGFRAARHWTAVS